MTQNTAMTRNNVSAALRLVRRKLTPALLLTLSFLLTCITEAWAQDDPYEGYWYIQSTQSGGDGFYMVPTIYSMYEDHEDTPFVTTYQTNKDNNSIWRIEKVKDGGDTYYHFIHHFTGKYLTANDVVDNNNPVCQRLHLETSETPGSETLFIIKKNEDNGRIAIRPKTIYGTHTNGSLCYWIEVSDNNQSNYWNGNYKGTLGFWNTLEEKIAIVAKWELKEVNCAQPLITYNESDGTFSLSYPFDDATGVTYYYTTDGSEPNTDSKLYTEPFANDNYKIVKAIAVKDGVSSNATELYAPHAYLFKTSDTANKSYYLLPPLDATYEYVTTSNVPNEKMVWQLKPATYDGIQSYYIQNQTTGEYLYCSGNMNSGSAFVMKPLGAEGTEDIRYKYCLYKGSTDDYEYFNITARKFAHKLPKDENNSLYKQNATDNANPTGLYKDNANGLPRWQAIDVQDDPRTLSALSEDFVSNDTETHYFKLRCALLTNSNTYYLYPPTTISGAAATNTTDANTEWLFVLAEDNDTWATYYYLRNATTGRYLYFDGIALNANENKFFASNDIDESNKDKYKFVVVKTANTTYAGTYHIIPKLIKDNANQAQIAMGRKNNDTALQTQNSRANGNSCWYLDTKDVYTVAPPIITYNASDNTVSLSCTTPDVTFYYTTDGSEPTTGSTLYAGTAFPLPDNSSTVKAIAMKGEVISDVASLFQPIHASVGDTKRIFYIQSVHNTNFYLIPNGTNVNTLSLPRPAMQWYAIDAGIENDVQYYYIVNCHADNDATNNTLGYLYCNGNSANMKSELDTSDDNYKFAILEHKTDGVFDGYYIMAKAKATAKVTENALQKVNNNNANNDVGTSGNSAYTWARWNIVLEKPTQHIDLILSTAEQKKTYSIGNVGQTGYITPPTGTYVTLASEAGNDQAWYFLEAAKDNWVTYYYIVHANTGKYLYFDGTTTSQKDEEKMVLKEKTTANEDQFQFAFANTIDDSQYYIIPKVHKYAYNNQYFLLYKANNALTLKTSSGRADNRQKWTFTEYAFKCSAPKFTYLNGTMTITCSTAGSTIYYAVGGAEPTISEECKYTGAVSLPEGDSPSVKAFAILGSDATYQSDIAEFTLNEISDGSQITNMDGFYFLANGFKPANDPIGTADNPFRGTIDGQLFPISDLNHPLIAYAENATIRNVILDNVTINTGNDEGNTAALVCEAKGDCRIYNCGVLGKLTETTDEENGTITSIQSSSTISGTGNVGSIVGQLNGNSRVINCYSYAEITGGTNVAGIVGYQSATADLTQANIEQLPMIVNCIFYGEISGGTTTAPVYGGRLIKNDGATSVNLYNYFRSEAKFDDNYTSIDQYKRSWPAIDKHLTRFEYYRSILNSNRQLCTWWVNGAVGVAPTDEDVVNVGIAKWVLDENIAPFPILKPWGKYPSIINPEPVNSLGILDLTVYSGDGHKGDGATLWTGRLTITDMDPEHHDFGYAKVQLPYYNELFGDPTADAATNWNKRYAGNYTDKVVTGWEITTVSDDGRERNSFVPNWEDGYNFADRNCTDKDLYSKSRRVFAQGGYYYVPEGVTGITITAHWGTAVYLRNTDNSIDRVNVTNSNSATHGSAFAPAGSLPSTFAGQTVKTSWREAIKALPNCDQVTTAGQYAAITVYDQAIVLVGNYQKQNLNEALDYSIDNKWHPFTIMSVDLDMDNEPDYVMQWQFRGNTDRWPLQPIRFDFVQVCELGMAIRHNAQGYALGMFAATGHFEITETSCMRTTQFVWDGTNKRDRHIEPESPLILNGGEFLQMNRRDLTGNHTNYIILGGHFYVPRFTPGFHANPNGSANYRHNAVNVMGGEFPEFYLSGIYRPDLAKLGSRVFKDNPHCYINGGKFGIIAGAGYEQIDGSVTFKIDHALIDEFYGGGINGARPITGSIDVTINNSVVGKYCGGPKVGPMNSGTTVTTNATNTVFGQFYGGGNGGTSYYREQRGDNDGNMPGQNGDNWTSYNSRNYGFNGFNPINTISGVNPDHKQAAKDGDDDWGYHAEYEFELFNQSNGINGNVVQRSYYHWAQFGTTTTYDVSNTLTGCTVNGDFYGGGNLANVNGNVTSVLTGGTTVHGSAFGAGFSATIPSFPIHDKATTEFPWRDKAGGIHDGFIPYVKDGAVERMYTWTNTPKEGMTGENRWKQPTYQGEDGKWYCWTWVSLENLGTVSGNASITIDGGTTIDGSVYGGGDESATDGSTTVTIKGGSQVLGDVFGGGNNGDVGGSTTVNIEE